MLTLEQRKEEIAWGLLWRPEIVARAYDTISFAGAEKTGERWFYRCGTARLEVLRENEQCLFAREPVWSRSRRRPATRVANMPDNSLEPTGDHHG